MGVKEKEENKEKDRGIVKDIGDGDSKPMRIRREIRIEIR